MNTPCPNFTSNTTIKSGPGVFSYKSHSWENYLNAIVFFRNNKERILRRSIATELWERCKERVLRPWADVFCLSQYRDRIVGAMQGASLHRLHIPTVLYERRRPICGSDVEIDWIIPPKGKINWMQLNFLFNSIPTLFFIPLFQLKRHSVAATLRQYFLCLWVSERPNTAHYFFTNWFYLTVFR